MNSSEMESHFQMSGRPCQTIYCATQNLHVLKFILMYGALDCMKKMHCKELDGSEQGFLDYPCTNECMRGHDPFPMNTKVTESLSQMQVQICEPHKV